MGCDVEAELPHVGDLVLGLRDDDRHVGFAHERDLVLDPRAFERRKACRALFQLGEVHRPLLGDEIVHTDRGRLVDRDEHRLAGEPTADEVADEIAGDTPQPRGAGDELVCRREAPRERAFLPLIELGLVRGCRRAPRRSAR